MAIIKPYSTLSTETQSLSDYPAVLHFFKCDEESGKVLTCAKTGITYTITALADGEFGVASHALRMYAGGGNTANSTSSNLTGPTKNNVMLMAVTGGLTAGDGFLLSVGNIGAAIHKVTISDLTTASSAVVGNTASATSVNATRGANVTAAAQAVSTWFDGANTMDARVFLDGNTPIECTADAVGATAITSFSNKMTVGNGATANVDIYGIMVLQFTTLPSDAFLSAMVNWHRTKWQAGEKSVYPGLKGLV